MTHRATKLSRNEWIYRQIHVFRSLEVGRLYPFSFSLPNDPSYVIEVPLLRNAKAKIDQYHDQGEG